MMIRVMTDQLRAFNRILATTLERLRTRPKPMPLLYFWLGSDADEVPDPALTTALRTMAAPNL